MNDTSEHDPAHSGHTPDVLARLRTALKRSSSQVSSMWGPSDTALGRRNEAKRALFRGAIAEIERLRAQVAALTPKRDDNWGRVS